MKEKKTLKEKWQDPREKIKIKFALWGIFFICVYIYTAIGNLIYRNSFPEENNQKEPVKISFSKLKQELLGSNLEIKYNINNYLITGTVINNILTGTLEFDDNIYKIKYDSNELYQISKETEEINNELLPEIKMSFLLPQNIIDIISQSDIIADKDETNKIYKYNINDNLIQVFYNEESIYKITVEDNKNYYILVYTKI